MAEKKNIHNIGGDKLIAYIVDKTTGRRYDIPYYEDGRCLLVGRKKEQPIIPDIEIDTLDGCMSGNQAYIWIEKNIIGEYALFIQDTATRKNETWVNEVIIDYCFKFQVYDQDIINMGETDFEVHFNPVIE